MNPDDPEAPLSPEEEAILSDFLERGLERYRALVPPDMLAQLREVGADGMRSHPALRTLVRRLAARPAPQRSGDMPKGGRTTNEGESGGKGEA